jgi:hypothetical protein
MERVVRNREYRAAIGVVAGFLILALRVAFNLWCILCGVAQARDLGGLGG